MGFGSKCRKWLKSDFLGVPLEGVPRRAGGGGGGPLPASWGLKEEAQPPPKLWQLWPPSPHNSSTTGRMAAPLILLSVCGVSIFECFSPFVETSGWGFFQVCLKELMHGVDWAPPRNGNWSIGHGNGLASNGVWPGFSLDPASQPKAHGQEVSRIGLVLCGP